MKHHHRKINRTAKFVVIALALVLLACNLPVLSLPGRQTATPPVEEEAAEPGTPTIDVSLLPPTKPQVVAQRPYPGEELPIDGSIDVYFDQPMNRDSVANAIEITPTIDTELVWVDSATLRISPTQALERAKGPVYLVTNEVGTGIVPENRLARLFRDAAGFVNQQMAACADRVVWMVAGIPVTIKSKP